jgi:ubiquinone/menaquinone biosynthesis C-methylase UbiE
MPPTDHHDWHSQAYVDDWVSGEQSFDKVRRPHLRRMLAEIPFRTDDEIRVVDVGGGYGVVTEEVLKAFPKARVTLQDYSLPMLDHARRRLAVYAPEVEYLHLDLLDPEWIRMVGGPFDMAVSSLVLHNLGEPAVIVGCYRNIRSVLKPGGVFLDYDLFEHVGGIELHQTLLGQAGFARVGCIWSEPPSSILVSQTRADRLVPPLG